MSLRSYLLHRQPRTVPRGTGCREEKPRAIPRGALWSDTSLSTQAPCSQLYNCHGFHKGGGYEFAVFICFEERHEGTYLHGTGCVICLIRHLKFLSPFQESTPMPLNSQGCFHSGLTAVPGSVCWMLGGVGWPVFLFSSWT